MSYFREFPDLEYQSFLLDKKSSSDYVRVKNIFRRVKLREDLQSIITLFNKYVIPDGVRPDNIAESLYGKADYDWVVLICAGIINVRNEWPISNREVYFYTEKKYGPDLNAIRHYETIEVLDSNGRLILPKGKIVDSNFTIPDPDNQLLSINPVIGVSNYEYEVSLNDKKRNIYLLRPQYLQQFLNDFRSIMKYEKSSQYVNRDLIKTENTRIYT